MQLKLLLIMMTTDCIDAVDHANAKSNHGNDDDKDYYNGAIKCSFTAYSACGLVPVLSAFGVFVC